MNFGLLEEGRDTNRGSTSFFDILMNLERASERVIQRLEATSNFGNTTTLIPAIEDCGFYLS